MAVLKSFVEVHPDSHFPIQNLPYGVFKPQPSSSPRPGVAIGDYVLDLSEIASAGLFDGPLLRNSDSFLQATIEPESRGCLLELTWNGQNALSVNGLNRKFLEDGDEVIISGYCKVTINHDFELQFC
ncbi:hypothetical protein V8G54_032109 [Vigna mungo]|uniref:Fumarylacetoacetase n=1 Tax=Vigna mungo TaxID=3915 RepID=A0AAQ3MLD3_VIGMU